MTAPGCVLIAALLTAMAISTTAVLVGEAAALRDCDAECIITHSEETP